MKEKLCNILTLSYTVLFSLSIAKVCKIKTCLLHYSMYVHRGTCAAQCCVNITDYSPSSDGITKQESYKNLGCFKLDMCLLQKWTICCETISEESWKNIAKIRDFCEQKQ